MTDSMNLISAQVTFLVTVAVHDTCLSHAYHLQETRLLLVHIPNEMFSFFIQPLFRILFAVDHREDAFEIPWTDRHEFLNLSITAVGCSLICSKVLVEKYLTPLVKYFNMLVGSPKSNLAGIEISHEEYVAIQVEGQGLDASQRVLELTGPLAMAGM